jgi:hypothetical protein
MGGEGYNTGSGSILYSGPLLDIESLGEAIYPNQKYRIGELQREV